MALHRVLEAAAARGKSGAGAAAARLAASKGIQSKAAGAQYASFQAFVFCNVNPDARNEHGACRQVSTDAPDPHLWL